MQKSSETDVVCAGEEVKLKNERPWTRRATPSLAALGHPTTAADVPEVGWGDAPSAYLDEEIPKIIKRLTDDFERFAFPEGIHGGLKERLEEEFRRAANLPGATTEEMGLQLEALLAAVDKIKAHSGGYAGLSMASRRVLQIQSWSDWELLRRRVLGPGLCSRFFYAVEGWGSGPGSIPRRGSEHGYLSRLRGATTPTLSARHSLAFEPDAHLLDVADAVLAQQAFARMTAASWWATDASRKAWSMRAAILCEAIVRVMSQDAHEETPGAGNAPQYGDPLHLGALRDASAHIGGIWQRSTGRDPYAFVGAFKLLTQSVVETQTAMAAMAARRVAGPDAGLDPVWYAGLTYELVQHRQKQGPDVVFAEQTMIPPRAGLQAISDEVDLVLRGGRVPTEHLKTLLSAESVVPGAAKQTFPVYTQLLAQIVRSPIMRSRGAMLMVLDAFGPTAATEAAEDAYTDTMFPHE